MTADNTVCQTQLKLNVTICNETWHVKCEEANGAHAPCQTDMRLSLNKTPTLGLLRLSLNKAPTLGLLRLSLNKAPFCPIVPKCPTLRHFVPFALLPAVRWLRPQSRSGEPIRRRQADVAVRRCWVNSFILTRLPRQLCNTGPSCKMHEHPSVRAP
jgi:hypothetical protein